MDSGHNVATTLTSGLFTGSANDVHAAWFAVSNHEAVTATSRCSFERTQHNFEN